jgi:hypothetical protein
MKKFTLFDKKGNAVVVEESTLDKAIKSTKIKNKHLDFYHEGDDCTDYFTWEDNKWKVIKNLKNLFSSNKN